MTKHMTVFGENYFLVSEGANIDMTKKFKEYKAEYKEEYKKIRKLIYKDKDYPAAKKEITKTKALVTKMKKDISDIDASSTGSQVFGFIAGVLINFAQIYIPAFLGGMCGLPIDVAKGSLTWAGGIKYLNKLAAAGSLSFAGIISILDIVNNKKDEKADVYKQVLLRGCVDLERSLDSMNKYLNKKK